MLAGATLPACRARYAMRRMAIQRRNSRMASSTMTTSAAIELYSDGPQQPLQMLLILASESIIV
jgi:hypothetical protein